MLASPYSETFAFVQQVQREEPVTLAIELDEGYPYSGEYIVNQDLILWYNDQEVDRIYDIFYSEIVPRAFHEDGTLWYQLSEIKGHGYSDIHITMVTYDGKQRTTVDTWTGNFLAGSYHVVSYEDRFYLGRYYGQYDHDIKTSRPTLTPELLKEVGDLELEIVKRFRLITQQQYQQAYQKIQDPDMTYEQFVQQRQDYDLVSVEYFHAPLIFFDVYPKTDTKRSEQHRLAARVFTHRNDGQIRLFEQNFGVTDDGQIILRSPMSWIDDTDTIDAVPRVKLVKLYYHRIANHQFEQAYALQHTHSQSLEKFAATYAKTLGIAIIESQIDGDGCFRCGDESKDLHQGQVDVLIDFVGEDSVERHHIQKQVIDGKLKHISTQPNEEDCIGGCGGYGYKPVIYLYPEQTTDVHVHLPLRGDWLVTYPQISVDDTRSVTAQPDGTLTNHTDGEEYSYLFWEGKMDKPWHLEE